MEILFGIAVFVLAAGGLGAGVALGRRPVATSCGGMDCVPGAACADCPQRRTEGEEAE